MPDARPVVVVAGLGDTGVLVATRLARRYRVVAVATRPGLVSGQELGTRLVDPDRWRRSYLVPYHRFRRLDRVERLHGRISAADLDAGTVEVALADGTSVTQRYDALVVATGVTNGFWRHDRVEDLAAAEAGVDAVRADLAGARTVAVVGGGATGVSVAANLARAGRADVHLFVSGDAPLPGYHPRVRRWATGVLTRDGVTLHPGHRAVIPAGFTGDRPTHEPVEWSTVQAPFAADVVLWATGAVHPHSGFLPAAVLDPDGFVRVDAHLRVPGYPQVFAVGDVAASDPLRSSARNWGYRVVVTNVRRTLTAAGPTPGHSRGRAPRRLARYRAPAYRWGSVLGLRDDGLTVVQPRGARFRLPRRIAEPLLFRGVVDRVLYGGLRPPAP